MFKFKLASILSLREKMEESKKRELGAANLYKDQLQAEELDLIAKREEAVQVIKSHNTQSIDIRNLRAFNIYDGYMKQAIERKNNEVKKAEKQVEEKREALLEAVKDKKIIENLKEIHKELFIEEQKQSEQTIVDDLVTYKYGRKGEAL